MAALQIHPEYEITWVNIPQPCNPGKRKFDTSERDLEINELRKSGKREQSMQALAGLAFAAYKQGELATAASHAEHLWQFWQDHSEWVERANLKLYWMLGLVWRGLKDSRFKVVRKQAKALLLERSEKIPDDGARQMFLQNVPVHRAITESL